MSSPRYLPYTFADRPLVARLLLMALFWGGTFIAGRHLAQTVPHGLAASIRYWLASVCLLPFALQNVGGVRAFFKLTPRQVAVTMACGLTGITIYNITFFGALELISGSQTALIVALNPIMTALMAALIFRDRLQKRQWAGVALALFGTGLVISQGQMVLNPSTVFSQLGRGQLIMLMGVLAWGVYTVLGRVVLKDMSAIVLTTWACLWGTLMLSLWAWWRGDFHMGVHLSLLDMAGIAYLGIFTTAISFVWFYQGVARFGPARTAVFTNLVPVFGVLLSGWLLKEPLLPSMLIGGLVVMGGVLLAQRG